MVGILD